MPELPEVETIRRHLAPHVEGRRLERLQMRMTGTLLLDPPADALYNRVWFELGDHRLAFTDPRRFGTGELALGPDRLDEFFAARLGVEPLGDGFTAAHLYGLARASRAP